ncbi:MAG: ribosome recycling factor [Patescibacteria group bacterium]
MSYDFSTFKKQLAQIEEWQKKEFQQMRTGQASPAILDGVRVESFGAQMSIREIASVTIEGARTIRISPWDKGQVKEIEKAISLANLGVSIVVDEQGLRVNFPELTSERRELIVKLAKEKLEEARRQIRQHRDTVIKDLQVKEKAGGMGKDEIFRLKNETQKIVDELNKKLEEVYSKKEKEILS